MLESFKTMDQKVAKTYILEIQYLFNISFERKIPNLISLYLIKIYFKKPNIL